MLLVGIFTPSITVAPTPIIEKRPTFTPPEIVAPGAALNPAEKRKLVKDARFGVDWIYEVAKRIAEKAA